MWTTITRFDSASDGMVSDWYLTREIATAQHVAGSRIASSPELENEDGTAALKSLLLALTACLGSLKQECNQERVGGQATAMTGASCWGYCCGVA